VRHSLSKSPCDLHGGSLHPDFSVLAFGVPARYIFHYLPKLPLNNMIPLQNCRVRLQCCGALFRFSQSDKSLSKAGMPVACEILENIRCNPFCANFFPVLPDYIDRNAWKLENRFKSKETLRRGDSNGNKQYFRNGLYVIGRVTGNLDQTTSGATEDLCEPGCASRSDCSEVETHACRYKTRSCGIRVESEHKIKIPALFGADHASIVRVSAASLFPARGLHETCPLV
jgi:hypothetical protein